VNLGLAVGSALCIGAGHCARLAPETFDQDVDTGTVLLVGEARQGDEAVERVVGLCPSGTVRWTTPTRSRQ